MMPLPLPNLSNSAYSMIAALTLDSSHGRRQTILGWIAGLLEHKGRPGPPALRSRLDSAFGRLPEARLDHVGADALIAGCFAQERIPRCVYQASVEAAPGIEPGYRDLQSLE